MLQRLLWKEIMDPEKLELATLCLPIGDDGSAAEHPGHIWASGKKASAKGVEIVTAREIAMAFNGKSRRVLRRHRFPWQKAKTLQST